MIHNLSIHGITSIKIEPIDNKESKDIPPYYHRKIVIIDRRGLELDLDLFGDREGDLLIDKLDG